MVLAIERLNQHYGSSHTLKDVSFTVGDGRCMAVMGRNGAGKTSLLKCIMGVIPATSGAIAFNGEQLADLPSHLRVGAGLGYVPQGREIFSNLTVRENLEMAMRANREPDPEAMLAETVEMFPVLGEMWHRRGGDLSGGQQQQLSIARALVCRPSLLILDEPTEGIQPSIVKRIEELIRSLKHRLSILVVEQYFEFARSMADDYVVMARGEIVAGGAVAEMDVDAIKRLLSV